MRFMTIVRSAERAGPPPKALMDAIANLGMEATQAGVLVEVGGLTPSAKGGRVRIEKGKIYVHDGPFAESKEVIGGFAVYDLSSKDEAMTYATKFMELHLMLWPGWEGEAEVRQMYGPNEFPS